ncbi:MAG: hypothetical protein ACOC22_04380 [bacterium]
MLQTVTTNISIITNFGCYNNCWYCIWKKHSLKDTPQVTNWGKLEEFFHIYKKYLKPIGEIPKVSVSGGGDPLYQFTKNKDWWDKLFKLASKHKISIDIHTREILQDPGFWKNINRCVFSSDDLAEDKKFLDFVNEYTKLRICHVATEYSTDKKIKEYIDYKNVNNCQFTVKELSGFDDKGRYKEICEKYKDEVYCLDYGDYNLYFMPNSTITRKFDF